MIVPPKKLVWVKGRCYRPGENAPVPEKIEKPKKVTKKADKPAVEKE